MKGWPVKRLPKLPCDGAFSVVTGATQVAEVDATAPHKDRDEQRGEELPLGLLEPGHLFQDIVDHCHKPCTGSSGSGIRSPHLTSSWPPLLTSFTQKMSEVLTSKVSPICSSNLLMCAWMKPSEGLISTSRRLRFLLPLGRPPLPTALRLRWGLHQGLGGLFNLCDQNRTRRAAFDTEQG